MDVQVGGMAGFAGENHSSADTAILSGWLCLLWVCLLWFVCHDSVAPCGDASCCLGSGRCFLLFSFSYFIYIHIYAARVVCLARCVGRAVCRIISFSYFVCGARDVCGVVCGALIGRVGWGARCCACCPCGCGCWCCRLVLRAAFHNFCSFICFSILM